MDSSHHIAKLEKKNTKLVKSIKEALTEWKLHNSLVDTKRGLEQALKESELL